MFLNLGLIGKPLKHSLSPFIHTRFLKNSGLNGGYCCFETDSGKPLLETLNFFKRYGFTGFNVTVPHKDEIFDIVDEIDDTASAVGAVNTVLISDKLKGYNTDAYGFEQMMLSNECDLQNSKVLLLGAGGSAKAVLYILKKYGVNLTVVNRSLDKAEKVLKSMNFDNACLEDYTFIKDSNYFDYVINATSIGLTDGKFIDMSNIECMEAAVDLQYKKGLTPFLEEMYKGGCVTIDGFSMLVHQAAKAFNIWTGVDPEFSVEEISAELGLI